jgi:hypothetical protein
MAIVFLATMGCTVVSVIILARKPLPSPIRFCSLTALFLAAITYNPILDVCYLTKSTTSLIVLWVTPVGSPRMLVFILLRLKRRSAGL